MMIPQRTGRLSLPAIILLAAAIMLIPSCMKKETFPVIPEIAYQGFTAEYDTAGVAVRGYLTITFRDGDGDIGLLPGQKSPPFDTGSPYYYNFIIDYWEQQNGVFVKKDLLIPFHARIPFLTPADANKAIKGYIVDTLLLNPAPEHDTVKLKFYIYDRALNQSNVDSTPPIILRRR